jgi:hypothetical protein
VSWVHQEDGYQLLCNRDEKRSRAKAAGPEVTVRDGVRFIAPVDGHAGGTWIGANEYGISLCLLNGRPSAVKREGKSRGLLLPELLTAQSQLEALERAWKLDLSTFAPFTLAILEPGHRTGVMIWDGAEKLVLPYAEPYMPLISSSFDPEGVEAKRRSEFQRQLRSAGRLNSAVLFDFHESHGLQPDAYSTCMHRQDAETVSFSWIKVTGTNVEFFYSPAAPCQWCPGQKRALPLVQ